MSNNVLIIIGMHRSGTSLVANWINRLGINLGDTLEGANSSNKYGHFEDADFLYLHENILRAHHLHPSGLEGPFELYLDADDLYRLSSIVSEKSKRRISWGWKEPRTCLFLDYYKGLIPQAKYLCIFRDYNQVVDSLVRRENRQYQEYYLKRSRLHRLKYKLFRTRAEIKIYERRNEFLDAWIIYNQKILSLLSQLGEQNYIALKAPDLIDIDKLIFDQLIRWGFDGQYFPFKEVYDALIYHQPEAVQLNNRLVSIAEEMSRNINNLVDRSKQVLSSLRVRDLSK